MKKSLFVIGSVAALSAGLAGASPAMAETVTSAEHAKLLDVYVDAPTGFTFVKMPKGWQFVGAVGQDERRRISAKSR